MRRFVEKHLSLLLGLILLLAITRLWLISLNTSFWVDEMVTVFVVQHGASHPSLDIAPQVSKSIYYSLVRATGALLGTSEEAYRFPSILSMGLALFLISRLAVRLIHPDAGWFAVFACLALKSLSTEAADARPYALGILVTTAALWFLVKWLDTNRWIPAFGFLLSAALVWRVHLLFWPFYLVAALYAIFRLERRDTQVRWLSMGAIFVAIAATLLPVAIQTVPILRQAHAHVFVPTPSWGELADALKWKLLLEAIAIGVVFSRIGATFVRNVVPASTFCLALGWWLIHPLALFAFSRLSGDSVFIPRYLSMSLPGVALAAATIATLLVPNSTTVPLLKYASLTLGLGVLLTVGNWRHPWTPFANSDWRSASMAVNELATGELPVIYPSPFIEARPPVWTPNYPLPGFLYSHLSVYPTGGHPFLFPFEDSPEADEYARELMPTLAHAGRFVIYGGLGQSTFWRNWFLKQPEFSAWQAHDLGVFGDVVAAVLQPAPLKAPP